MTARSRSGWAFIVSLTALAVAVLGAFAIGRYPVGPAELGVVLWAKVTGAAHGFPPAVEAVIFGVRGPRVLAALAIGAALAVAGAAYQSLFRNPLVSPDILGVSAGAAVMDEPTASLDFGNQVRVLAEIERLKASGAGVLLSTHDPDHALQLADRVALLHDGRLVADEPPDDAITPDRLRRVYGVDVAIFEVSDPTGSARRVCVPARRPQAAT